ncbi:bactofilin family protein [Longimicrobium sp.]|uniref:bactofilin family protein n=1 Tax=Longimicrobium sp. TaxID=2029185 RepID=UPI003B3BB49E
MLGGKKSTDRAALPRGSGNEGTMSIIGSGMNIVGDLSTDGSVRVEGRIEGTVRAGKTVIITNGGEVVGDVLTQDAVIGGMVRGTVVAESRLEMQATCDIEGSIRARSKHLKLEEGCRFSGQIQMLDGGEALALPAPARVENSTQMQGLSTP